MFEMLKAGIDGLRRRHSGDTAETAVPERDTESSDGGATEDGRRVPLFHCPTCETVYLATAKETCSDCGSTVEEVSSRSERA